MTRDFRVAVAQCVSLTGGVDANLETAEALCRQAGSDGADLILFPETHATGYSYRDLRSLVEATAEPITGRIVQAYREMACANDLVVCGGMFEREGEDFFNSHVVAYPDGRIDVQRKGLSSPAETGVITLERGRRVFEWADVRFGILICADSALEDAGDQIAALGISLLLHPCAGRILFTGPEAKAATQAEADTAFDLGLRSAAQWDVAYAAANLIGFSGEDFYPGNSWVIRPDGSYHRMDVTALPSEMTSSVAVENVCASVFVS